MIASTLHCIRTKHDECEAIFCDRCRETFHDSVAEWRGIRAIGHGLGAELSWRCPRCVLAKPLERIELYHVRHTCGHSAFWENGFIAAMTKGQKCPWCGGENGRPFPRTHPYFDYGPPYGRVINNGRMRGPDDPEEALVHHYPDNSCCQGINAG